MDSAVLDTTLTEEEVRQRRIAAEREFYLDPKNYIDFIRDFGACPDAQENPHAEGARFLMNWTLRPGTAAAVEGEKGNPLYFYKLMLWPRGSFKSHGFDVGYASWRIAKDPNVRILVASETSKQAQVFVGAIMEVIGSARFKEVFGDHTRGRWYQGKGFWSSQRTKLGLKEPTLWATGCEQVQTGMHWDLVICDDIVSQENTKTPEAIETVKSWLGETLAQLDPGCMLFLIGTRHHYADVYGWILKDPTRRAMFEVSIKKWKDPATGKLFFPQRLSEAYVMGQKALLVPRQWSAYYENDPASEDERIFLPSYFHTIRDHDIPNRSWTYILTDFAFRVQEKNDRTCFWVVSIDPNRVAYVRDFIVGRWKPSESVRIAIALWNKYIHYNMKGMSIEDTTHKELLAGYFEEVRKETFLTPRIIPITGRSEEIKDIRIESAEPRFRGGRIYFAESVKGNASKWVPLIDEMTEWPFSEHDDIPDAISDLDKTDQDGMFLLPHPPMSFQTGQVRTQPLDLIDGKFNPSAGYDARRMIAHLQKKHGQDDLWQGGRAQQPDDLWHRKGPGPEDMWR